MRRGRVGNVAAAAGFIMRKGNAASVKCRLGVTEMCSAEMFIKQQLL